MAFRRDAFERFGGFRTDLGRSGGNLMSGEDAEFCFRLIHAGEFLMYAPEAIVYHPVAPERLKKSYFRTWYFEIGRAAIRMEGVAKGAQRYWGIPRYLLRQCAPHAVRWLFSAAPDKRFYYELQTRQILGMMAEARQMRAERKSLPPG
jgi:GT2 family glycosyltransferase